MRESVTCQWVRKDGMLAHYEVRFFPLHDVDGAIVAVAARALDMAVGRSAGTLIEAIGDAAALRAELVQVAAVAVAWVEALDRRQAVSRG